MYTLATNIRNWEMKVARRLNHRENSEKPTKTKGGPPEGRQNHRENSKKQKNQRFHADPEGSTLGAHPASA